MQAPCKPLQNLPKFVFWDFKICHLATPIVTFTPCPLNAELDLSIGEESENVDGGPERLEHPERPEHPEPEDRSLASILRNSISAEKITDKFFKKKFDKIFNFKLCSAIYV
jgi:hypothetical protein